MSSNKSIQESHHDMLGNFQRFEINNFEISEFKDSSSTFITDRLPRVPTIPIYKLNKPKISTANFQTDIYDPSQIYAPYTNNINDNLDDNAKSQNLSSRCDDYFNITNVIPLTKTKPVFTIPLNSTEVIPNATARIPPSIPIVIEKSSESNNIQTKLQVSKNVEVTPQSHMFTEFEQKYKSINVSLNNNSGNENQHQERIIDNSVYFIKKISPNSHKYHPSPLSSKQNQSQFLSLPINQTNQFIVNQTKIENLRKGAPLLPTRPAPSLPISIEKSSQSNKSYKESTITNVIRITTDRQI